MAGLSTSLVPLKVVIVDRARVNEQFVGGGVARLPFLEQVRGGDVQQQQQARSVGSARSLAGRRHHRRRAEDVQGSRLLSRREEDRKHERSRGQDRADEKVVITIDMDQVRERVWRAGHHAKGLLQASAKKLVDAGHGFAEDGVQVLRDLRSSVAVQDNARVVVALRKSSLEFGVRAVLWSVVVVVLGRIFLKAARRYRWGWEEGIGWSRSSPSVVRDRSLGGREVTVRARSPLDGVSVSRSEKDMIRPRRARVQVKREESQLPGWWPGADSPPILPVGLRRNEARMQAQRLVQAMIKKRIAGQDFMEEDILELRRLCRDSGATVTFDTTNSRDSFYRTAVNYVLSATSRLGTGLSLLELGNEDAAKFLAGLAGHTGLDAKRAATMVDAAVAARTRSGFLQAWALLKQRSMVECEQELLKLVRLHSCFPPERNSPEMELVARGLTSYLPEEQRKQLLEIYVTTGGSDTVGIAEEALGLISAFT